MGSTDKIVDVQDYLGDASKSEWVAQGTPLGSDDGLLLTMPRNTAGTVLSSTGYLWYGNVKARMKTSRGRGVVTGFILMSDVKDEIDFEWVGADLEVTQTNYYFQGIPDCKLKLSAVRNFPAAFADSCLQTRTRATLPVLPTPLRTGTIMRFGGHLMISPGS